MDFTPSSSAYSITFFLSFSLYFIYFFFGVIVRTEILGLINEDTLPNHPSPLYFLFIKLKKFMIQKQNCVSW